MAVQELLSVDRGAQYCPVDSDDQISSADASTIGTRARYNLADHASPRGVCLQDDAIVWAGEEHVGHRQYCHQEGQEPRGKQSGTTATA
jgi:hypothetical protein